MTRRALPDPRVFGRTFLAGGRIVFETDPDGPEEPRLAAEPDADELGLDPNVMHDPDQDEQL